MGLYYLIYYIKDQNGRQNVERPSIKGVGTPI